MIPDLPDEEKDEGSFNITIKTEDNEKFVIEFNFVKRATDPSAHTPFPSPDSENEIYAWPAEEIPEELTFDVDTVEATSIVFETSTRFKGINLLNEPYSKAETIESPFVNYN